MRRGQALVEVALVAPLLTLLLVLPLAAHRWATARLQALDGARQRAWDATAGLEAPPAAAGVEVRASRHRDGRVRASASVGAPRLDFAALIGRDERPSPPREVLATVDIYSVAVDAGTEEAGRAAVRARWLGGALAAPARVLLRALLREDPVRVEFGVQPAQPPGRRP